MKKKAIQKVQESLDKDIALVEALSKACGLGELLFFFYFLHFTRILHLSPRVSEDNLELTNKYKLFLDEVYKYLIQIAFKNCTKRFIKQSNDHFINNELTVMLTQLVSSLTNKHETLTFLTHFSNIEFVGDKEQTIKVNFDEYSENGRIQQFLHYGMRVDEDNNRKKINAKTKEDLFNNFKNEYSNYEDLFELEFGLSIDRFVEILNYLLEEVTNKILAEESKYVKLPDGNIDVQSYITIMHFIKCLFIPLDQIHNKFQGDELKVIEKLSFKTEDFDPYQLRFNLCARQPLFVDDGYLYLSPEILLDSLYINSHYSLLESDAVKNEYKARYSDFLLEKIAEIGKKHGYKVFYKELELYEGKNQIGDIDIILHNEKTDHYLLVEAKNHALPLDVYFHDLDATERRLEYLQKEWEAKVDKRNEHMKKNHNDYNVGESFTYVIVSRHPEILSHFSKFIVLNTNEFDLWLESYFDLDDCNEILANIYKYGETSLSEEDLKMMGEDLFKNWKFGKDDEAP